MCGICGFVSKKPITIEELKTMNDLMIHRGPDDSGEEIYESRDGYTVGFAQRRLSILDLSPLGHQPMHSPCEAGTSVPRISVVFNGEIYNYLELKKEIPDYPFRSTCDTELIIAAYLKWGKSCFNRFNGMFAIALYDRETGEIILVRDRIGKKPLYYWRSQGNLVFASELKPIMAHPEFVKNINDRVLARFIYQQYILSPDTIFEDVYKLEPGTVLTFKAGTVSKEKYWDVNATYSAMKADPVTDYNEAKQELKRLLKESVRLRMISDVPVGTFLSGGYDSSLITAIAADVCDSKVKTFTIGFGEKDYNEAVYAAEVSAHLGTEHTERYIEEDEMYKLVDSIPQYFDEPMADSSQIPTMLVSALAKEKVTVALSGDGGDEFYCGYNVYDNVAQAQKLDALGAMVDGTCNLLRLKDKSIYNKIPFRVRVVSENRNKLAKSQISSMGYVRTANAMVLSKDSVPCKYEIEDRYDEKNWLKRRMLVDMDTYLPDDILCKVDRASMKYSLESRCPILDKDVMEYSYRLPHDFKYHDRIRKHILKDIAHDYIPKTLLDRPKKGFGVPLDKWMRGPLKERLIDYTDRDFLVGQGLFDPVFTADMVGNYLKNGDAGPATGQNFSKVCWSFFVFEQWYEHYFK
ncbi:MAG: asparagine synthase (glutamine-hydrolyzing) [Lachnospiraceae bacterium]|nr:asparagine synthase (glutamine-hydrolyzing) [Lachnospiraceae bacterium]